MYRPQNPLWKKVNRQIAERKDQMETCTVKEGRSVEENIQQLLNQMPSTHSNSKKNKSKKQEYDEETQNFMKELQLEFELADIKSMDESVYPDLNMGDEDVSAIQFGRPGGAKKPMLALSVPCNMNNKVQKKVYGLNVVIDQTKTKLRPLSQYVAVLKRLQTELKQEVIAQYFRFYQQIKEYFKEAGVQSIITKLATQMAHQMFEQYKEQQSKTIQISGSGALSANKNLEQGSSTKNDVYVSQLQKYQRLTVQQTEKIFELEQEVSQRQLYVDERIKKLLEEGTLKMVCAADQQSNYRQKINDYEYQIGKLSNLVDQLEQTYKKEILEKQSLNEQKNRLIRECENLKEKEEKIIEQQANLQRISLSLQQSRRLLQNENKEITAKRNELQEIQEFLKTKMEQMDALEKQLNQGYRQFDELIREQQNMRKNQFHIDLAESKSKEELPNLNHLHSNEQPEEKPRAHLNFANKKWTHSQQFKREDFRINLSSCEKKIPQLKNFPTTPNNISSLQQKKLLHHHRATASYGSNNFPKLNSFRNRDATHYRLNDIDKNRKSPQKANISSAVIRHSPTNKYYDKNFKNTMNAGPRSPKNTFHNYHLREVGSKISRLSEQIKRQIESIRK